MAVSRLRGTDIVPEDLLPLCGLEVKLERDGKELVERVYDLDNNCKCVQEIVVPKALITMSI